MKKAIAILIGNSLEWYEFSIFIFLGHYLTQSIGLSQHILYVSLGLLVSFMSRPLGSIIYGYLGDKKGRKYALITSVTLMTLSTSLMGLIPSGDGYQLIGIICLFILRFLQGVSGGGEFTTSVTTLYELKKGKGARFITSLSYASAQFGFLLGLCVAFIVTTLINAGTLPGYAWRVTFLLGLPIGICIYVLRLKFIKDDISFISSKTIVYHLKAIFSFYPKSVLAVLMMNAYAQLLFYMFSFHILKWNRVCQIDGRCSANIFFEVSGYIFLLIILIPLSSVLFKNLKIVRVLGVSSLAALLLCLVLINTPESISVRIMFLLSLATLLSCLPEYFSSLFPREYRNAGISIPFNVAAAIWGGLTPLMFSFFNGLPGSQTLAALYVLFSFILFYNGLRLNGYIR